ncbi:MAG: 2TM domain-containing protein [Flavobacteriaceae bacterium]|nr:2TM domain-containing protein [Flavobacteriaceae bacterium]
MENSYEQEQRYLKAKKRVKEIRGFYIHLVINIVSILIIVIVNLLFSPGYHWFWFAVIGIVIAQLIHALLVFGFPQIGFGKDWENKKIEELLSKEEKIKTK